MNNLPIKRLSLQRQQGAVLIVSLTLLIVITMLGLASMSSSVMQEKMAANAQNTNRAFQAAESGVSNVISNALIGVQNDLSNAMTSANSIGPQINYDVADADINSSYQVTYLGVVSTPIGQSLDNDASSSQLQAHRFEVAGTGSMTSVNGQAVIQQGIEYY